MKNETKVGIVVLVGIALLMGMVSFLGLFSFQNDEYQVIVSLERSGGLRKGDNVHFLGVPVGKVKNIEVVDKRVHVKTAIKNDVKIPEGSLFMLGIDGMMGSGYIDIQPPNTSSDNYLQNGAVVNGALGASMGDVLMSASGVMEKLAVMADSVNVIFNNKDVQDSIISVVKNTKDITNSINDMTKVFASVTVENQEEIDLMVKQLSSMSVRMNAVVTRVDTMLQGLDNNGQTNQNIITTLNNLKTASENVEKITRSIEGITGDTNTQKDIKETIKNAKEASAKANKLLGGMGQISTKTSFDFKYGDKPDKYRFDANLRLNYTKKDFFVLGIADVGESNDLNLQLGKGNDYFALRGGLVLGDLGAGVDIMPTKWFRLSADAYDPNDFKFMVSGEIKLSDKFSIVGESLNIRKSASDKTYVGVRGYF